MAEEKIFTINLRKLGLKDNNWQKTKKSVAKLKRFLMRHMKTDEIKLDKSITEEIWKRGARKPPAKIRVKVYETEEGEKDEKKKVVKAELLGVIHEEVKEKKKEIEKKIEEKAEKELPKNEDSKSIEKK